MSDLQAVILAGGLGTRLRAKVADRPKALAPVNGKPFLAILLSMLARKGFSRIILATGYMGDLIAEAIGERFDGMEIRYSHEHEPLGTGGALTRALSICESGLVFTLNGDTWLDVDYGAMADQAARLGGLTLAGAWVDDTSRYGRLTINNGRIEGIREKTTAGPGYINAGCYGATKDLLADSLPQGPFSLEKDFLHVWLAKSGASLYPVDGAFFDIGAPASYEEFSKYCFANGR